MKNFTFYGVGGGGDSAFKCKTSASAKTFLR